MPTTSSPLPWLLAGGVSLTAIAAIAGLSLELSELRHEQQLAVQSQSDLRVELGGVDAVVERLIGERIEPLIRSAEAEREALEAALAERDALLLELGAATDRLRAEGLEARIAAIDASLVERFASVETRVSDALEAAVSGRDELESLRQRLPRAVDPDRLWTEIVAPVVQVNGELSVGSAVVLESQPTERGMRTPILTAWHVVRDVQDDPSDPITPVPIRIFDADGDFRDETARVLAHDASRDIALLELDSARAVAHGARIAPRERLLDVRTFDQVFAVGCPLGTEPVPTFGSVATNDHEVDDERYWMINAPTYIGNSGGGIFDAATGELLGVFSKIYNHGSLRPTIVPHMGLVIPLDEVYTWLEREGFELREGVGGGLTIDRTAADETLAEAR